MAFCKINTPLGDVCANGDADFLTALWFADQKRVPVSPAFIRPTEGAWEGALRQWLALYFAGKRPDPAIVPLKLEGTPFRLRVWELLQRIPYGHTGTYRDLAREFSLRMAPQAIGNAVGHNPISLIVPCHRIIGTNGSLTGYAGGLERKKALLDLESAPA
jgi:methylated-DNA-[protein]-cysteine S-methyltransferase